MRYAMNQVRVLSFLLAGGIGSRLGPLTWYRTKPSVPFAGKYRIIDFAMSNFINSGFHAIYVLTQFKSQELAEHISRAWSMGNLLPGYFCTTVPAQMQTAGRTWYQGTADAIYQNIPLILDRRPEYVLVFGSDHIYRMDIRQMWEYHVEKEAEGTVACLPTPIEEASRFGVVEIDDDWRIVGFQEKPADPRPIPGRPGWALVSMGNYIFNAEFLKAILLSDAKDEDSTHDFGRDLLPAAARKARLFAYDFLRNRIPGQAGENLYWRDIGTVDSYWSANMDLRSATPAFDLYNRQWPVLTYHAAPPPSKFVHNEEGRTGSAVNSIVSGGTIISGASVVDSVIGKFVRLNSYSKIEESILFDGVIVGRRARIRQAIIDEGIEVAPGERIGFDREEDRRRGFYVSPNGIVVVGRAPYAAEDPWRSVEGV